MIGRLIITIACVGFVHTKPIMVSFGTNGGPIVPPTPSTTTLNPLASKNPAPVYEDQSDDIPPPVYRAPTPNQYRNLINSYKPNPSLQLGTPLDIKYQDLNTISQLQIQQQKAEYARQQGLAYHGAQVFSVQEYEYDNARNRQQQTPQGQGSAPTKAQQFVQQYVPKRQILPVQTQASTQAPQTQTPTQQPEVKQNVRQQRHQEKDQAVQGSSIRYTNTPIYTVREEQPQQQQPQPNYQFNYNYNQNQQQHQQQQQIPGFGVAFSSGLRYYVPQFYYYDSRQQQQQQQQQYQPNYHNRNSHRGYNEVSDNTIFGN